MNALLMSLAVFVTSIYNLQFTDTDGNTVQMSNYQNKKILLVNIATGSQKVSQLAGLQQLQQTYGDSLTVIVFPSNSFGNESRTNAEIKQFCQTGYGATFKIAAKSVVSGTGINPVFSWLSQKTENGSIDAAVVKDFQKFLIDKDGKLIGVFGASVAPLDNQVVNAITAN
ncbi:MAG: glutathione peroxidase [Bacteroidetes bacterium]|nr:glutathione peroxidase [Bacteroidota bacterium]